MCPPPKKAKADRKHFGGMKMKKKLFAILLSIVMVVGLLPVTALAADPTVYGIWVDGVQVTSENKDNLFSGTVSYDPTTHTLSLFSDVTCTPSTQMS